MKQLCLESTSGFGGLPGDSYELLGSKDGSDPGDAPFFVHLAQQDPAWGSRSGFWDVPLADLGGQSVELAEMQPRGRILGRDEQEELGNGRCSQNGDLGRCVDPTPIPAGPGIWGEQGFQGCQV